MRGKSSSVWVPRKLLARLHEAAGYKPLHVEIEEGLLAKKILAEVDRISPEATARARAIIEAAA